MRVSVGSERVQELSMTVQVNNRIYLCMSSSALWQVTWCCVASTSVRAARTASVCPHFAFWEGLILLSNLGPREPTGPRASIGKQVLGVLLFSLTFQNSKHIL